MCKIASSFTDAAVTLMELTAYFKDNVPRNEATLLYTDETTVLVQLRKGTYMNDFSLNQATVTPVNFIICTKYSLNGSLD